MKSQVIQETVRWNVSHFLLSHLNILEQYFIISVFHETTAVLLQSAILCFPLS